MIYLEAVWTKKNRYNILYEIVPPWVMLEMECVGRGKIQHILRDCTTAPPPNRDADYNASAGAIYIIWSAKR